MRRSRAHERQTTAAINASAWIRPGQKWLMDNHDPATLMARQQTKPFVQVPVDKFKARLVAAGHTEVAAQRRANVDRAIAAGELFIDSGDLRRLVGRPPATLSAAIAQALG